MNELPFGWLSDDEAACLAELAQGKRVLEVGAFLGRSTVVLARVAELVVSIDHHRGSPEHQAGEGCFIEGTLDQHELWRLDTAPLYLSNLSKFKVRDQVCAVVGNAAQMLPLFAPDTFDLAFIDGAHDFESAKNDGLAAVRVLHFDGTLVFHDGPTVRGSIEAVAQYAPGRRIVSLAGSLVAIMLA